MTSNNSNQWKDALLRSSLPLEYLVAQKFRQLGIFVSGEYTYLRHNENGINTEFSTDIWAFEFLMEENLGKDDFWASCNFIIECKYTHKSVNWIFSPHPHSNDECFVTGYVNVFQDLCVKQIDTNLLSNFDENLKHCIKGIEIFGKDCNPNTISKGLSQLQYASIHLSKSCMTQQICAWHDEELKIEFLFPILLTTAPLYVMKENLLLNNFYQAENLEDVADQVNSLIVYQNIGVQQKKYIKELSKEFCDTYKDTNLRLKEIDDILKYSDYKGYHMSDDFFLADKLGSASERILIVNYEHLEECINDILNVVKTTLPTLKRYAVLKYDDDKKRAVIQPCL
jgi:hypothetical protein